MLSPPALQPAGQGVITLCMSNSAVTGNEFLLPLTVLSH